jgi:hypothetical protein
MPTLQELIEQLNAAVPEPDAVEPDADPWRLLDPEWPPFEPPRVLPPRRRLTLEWLWGALWRERLEPPDADELIRAAAKHDEEFPEAHEAL